MNIYESLDDYQHFTASTAVYPALLAIPYLGLGLGDEAGELLEKITIMHSSGKSSVWGAAHVLPEIGDVVWYLAQLLLKRGHSLGAVYAAAMQLDPDHEASLTAAGVELVIAAAALQGRLKKEIRDVWVDEALILHHAARILRAGDSIARWFGSNLTLVVAGNRAKLTDRLARDVIKGDGDVR